MSKAIKLSRETAERLYLTIFPEGTTEDVREAEDEEGCYTADGDRIWIHIDETREDRYVMEIFEGYDEYATNLYFHTDTLERDRDAEREENDPDDYGSFCEWKEARA